MGAEQLASQKVGVVADALAVLHVLAPSAQYGIGLFPQLLGHDRRYDLAGFILEHDPFLRREEFLLFGEHIHHFDLVSHVVAFVLGLEIMPDMVEWAIFLPLWLRYPFSQNRVSSCFMEYSSVAYSSNSARTITACSSSMTRRPSSLT